MYKLNYLLKATINYCNHNTILSGYSHRDKNKTEKTVTTLVKEAIKKLFYQGGDGFLSY